MFKRFRKWLLCRGVSQDSAFWVKCAAKLGANLDGSYFYGSGESMVKAALREEKHVALRALIEMGANTWGLERDTLVQSMIDEAQENLVISYVGRKVYNENATSWNSSDEPVEASPLARAVKIAYAHGKTRCRKQGIEAAWKLVTTLHAKRGDDLQISQEDFLADPDLRKIRDSGRKWEQKVYKIAKALPSVKAPRLG